MQGLVRELRTRVDETSRREAELLTSQDETRRLVENMAAVTDATREISRTTDAEVARHVICSAACTITGGRFATLLEPDGEGALVMSANHGLQGSPPIRIIIGAEASGAAAPFLSGRSQFVDDAREDPSVSQRLTKSTGAVSVHFEPVLRNEETIGVLAVGWDHVISGLERQAISAIRMLAAETAMMIERADLLAQLEASAQDRRPHGPAQPARLGRGAARDGARASFGPSALCGDARSRLLQGLQRRARASGRRPAAQARDGGLGR